MIPVSNVHNLALREEVVQAVKAGKFHVWAVTTIDEGIEILTGVKAGGRLPEGGFEADSVHALVDKRLKELADRLAAFGRKDGHDEAQ